LGVDKRKDYAIASKDRAFLDFLYLGKSYHFDNIISIKKNAWKWFQFFVIRP
jgi:hypothetical protein